jgi:hypothetical protein
MLTYRKNINKVSAVIVKMDKSLTKEQLIQKLLTMGVQHKLDEVKTNKYASISQIVHIIATEEDMNYLVDKCGSCIVRPLPCLLSQLSYSVMVAFPKKRFCLAWTDSMDFYVVGMTSFLLN